EVVRDLAVLAYVVGLSALGDAGVQGDGLHRSHSWMSMAVVSADPGPVGGAVPFSSRRTSRTGSSTAGRRIGREKVTTSSPIPRTVVWDPLSCGSMVVWVTSEPSWRRRAKRTFPASPRPCPWAGWWWWRPRSRGGGGGRSAPAPPVRAHAGDAWARSRGG